MLTPLKVARSQVLTAIELFFADKDPVSVQSLAGNAREILESLCRISGIEPMTELLLRDHPAKAPKDIYAAMNLYRNCFKHVGKTPAEREDDQLTLNQFDDSKNEYLLYICVEDYIRLRQAMPIPMQIFQAWFCACHADLLASHIDPQRFYTLFPGINNMTRAERKRVAVACAARYSDDPDLLADPKTEPLEIEA